MESANIVLRLMAASQIVLFFGMLVMSKNPPKVRVVGCLLMIGIISYLTAPLCSHYTDWTFISAIWLPASIVPSVLLLFVWMLCEEDVPVPAWLSALIISSVAVSTWAHMVHFEQPNDQRVHSLAQVFKIAAVVMAIYVLWKGRDHDLVELRIKFRNLLVLVISVTALGIIMVELVTGFAVPIVVEIAGMGVIFTSALLFNLYFIRLNPAIKLVGEPALPIDNTEDEMIQNLLSRMQDERLYADHDLRVAGLADILGVPEYQLRKRINQKLGYRNFNQFVNRYRIQEAGERLIKDMKSPVLTIALDVGFRSISSFNTAFQTQFGVSPTRYRAEHQLNS